MNGIAYHIKSEEETVSKQISYSLNDSDYFLSFVPVSYEIDEKFNEANSIIQNLDIGDAKKIYRRI